mgnify:FL=1
MKKQDKKTLPSYPAVPPASLFPLSDQSGDLRTPAISGRKCAASLKNCAPIGCLAKMLLTSSIWGSTKRSLTWNRRDMQFGHSYFLLVPSAHGMNASGLLSWGLIFPTPLASDTGTRPRVSRVIVSPNGAFRRRKKNGSYWTVHLSEAVYYLEQGAEESLRFNPEWVEWLMGFPRKWTEISSGE